jgi:hypothetical protein
MVAELFRILASQTCVGRCRKPTPAKDRASISTPDSCAGCVREAGVSSVMAHPSALCPQPASGAKGPGDPITGPLCCVLFEAGLAGAGLAELQLAGVALEFLYPKAVPQRPSFSRF